MASIYSLYQLKLTVPLLRKNALFTHTYPLALRAILFNIEPVHEISNNLVCATSKASDQPAHTRSLIRAFASRLIIL